MADTQLAQRAQEALQRNTHLARQNVQFEADAGRLTLRGRVGSYFQKQMVQESLRGIEGLHTLDNLLEVHWGPRRTSDTLPD